VATDHRGAPVSDLTAGDFVLTEDGVAQKISSFAFQHPGTGSEPPEPLPPNVFANLPQFGATSLNIILLDGLNGNFSSRAHAYDELMKYLDSQSAVQPTAIYSLDRKLRLLHDFTTDTAALRAAMVGFKPQAPPRLATVEATASPFEVKSDFQVSENNIEATLRALKFLARSLAGYKGRKNLIWLSEAFPVSLFPDDTQMPATMLARPVSSTPKSGGGDSVVPTGVAAADAALGLAPNIQGRRSSALNDFLAMVQEVADDLMSAQVAVYPIDAAGVGKISRLDGLATMRQMAERTGGLTFANQNGLIPSLQSSMDEGATYYTLAYYPDNKNWDGRFRRIEVRTERSGIRLRFRQGYYALDPDAAAPKKPDNKKLSEEFTQALSLDVPSVTGILFRATVSPPEKGDRKMVVNFAIDPRTLKFEEAADGVELANVSCALVAFSAKGSAVKEELNNMSARVQAAQFPKLMRASFPCQITTTLGPGKYTLRFGVMDRNSQTLGTATGAVVVP